MKKRVVCIVLISLVIFSFIVIAQDNSSIVRERNNEVNSEKLIDKAYQCLKDNIEKKDAGSVSLQEAVFSTLALGSQNKLTDIIQNMKSNEACWPKSGCKLTETAQAILAYGKVGKNTKDIESWLLSKTKIANELTWYLEIDIQNHAASECTLKYDSQDRIIRVKDDMKLEGDPGSCFAISYGGYWLQIRDRCLDKEFEISCNQDFVTTLVYQKSSGGTVFVSSQTDSSASLGTTMEKVNSKCFGTSAKCDYEGTLWATLALEKSTNDISSYVPYLFALSSENQKFFPSAFLYILTRGDEKYSEIIQKQKPGNYWDNVGSPYNRFYDTSLAMLALSGTGSLELEAAKSYLLGVQTKEGCWNNNNIRDTAFILYSGFTRQTSGTPRTPGESLCESAGNFCVPVKENDCLSAKGTVYDDKVCAKFTDICCSVRVSEQSCAEKGGLVCSLNQECNGRIESSSDGSCCLDGACINKQVENICETLGKGSCRNECFPDEEKTSDTCPDSGDVCCIEKEQKQEPSKGISIIWIIILIVLVIIIVLAIIYRHRLQIWWHQRRSSHRPAQPPRGPPVFPGMMSRPMMPRYGPPGSRMPLRPAPPQRIARPSKSPQDKEMDETMRKLKEMSG